MIIKELYYLDSRSKIEISAIVFNKFNALVGHSGAGKTTIIRAIGAILKIASGHSEPADSWKISFQDDDGDDIFWEGTYSSNIEFDDDKDEVSELTEERLTKNGNEIFKRDENETTYDGSKLPLIDKYKSLIYVLRDDPKISPIYKSLKSVNIILNDSTGHSHTSYARVFNPKSVKKNEDKIKENTDDILNILNDIKADCRERIYYIHKFNKERFEDFEFLYTSIFPDVVNIVPELSRSSSSNSAEDYGDRSALLIKLKMKSGSIVEQGAISSGMFKTMMILSELEFGNRKSPIIIDEIENSLGTNCLPDITGHLQSAENQIIITTHHPQIIEITDPKFYKIVSRDGGKITSVAAKKIEGSSSHHERYIQLINSLQYKGKLH